METVKTSIKKYRVYLEIGCILAIIAVLYKSTFLWLYERYSSADSYYSHGFLIPFVTAYLIWLKKEELENLKPRQSIIGLVFIIFALLMHFAAILIEVFFVSGFSLFVLVIGISLFLYGKEITRKILFPLLFLIFMIPLPLTVIGNISFALRMVVTKISVFIMKATMHIPVQREGFQLLLPNDKLIVGNPCSGLRSLISLLALGSIFSYLFNGSRLKKNILFLLTVPIAIFSNIVRVILLTLAVFVYGSKMASGFFHDFTGYLVFVIAFGGLWAVWRALR